MTMKEKVRWAGIAAIAALLLLFVLFNLDAVRVNIILGEVRVPIGFLILFSAASGAGGMWLFLLVKPRLKKDQGPG